MRREARVDALSPVSAEAPGAAEGLEGNAISPTATAFSLFSEPPTAAMGRSGSSAP